MATKKTMVRFETGEYRRSHGAEPRGFGRWAFCEERFVNTTNYLAFTFFANGTLGEAKKAARAHFEALGAKTGAKNLFVAVMP